MATEYVVRITPLVTRRADAETDAFRFKWEIFPNAYTVDTPALMTGFTESTETRNKAKNAAIKDAEEYAQMLIQHSQEYIYPPTPTP